MSANFYVRQNDNFITIGGTCLDALGAAVSLTGVTGLKLQVRAKYPTSAVAILNVDATADSDQTANKGQWSYVLLAADLALSGDYQVSIQATWGDGKVATFPSNQDLNPAWITIDPELA